MSEKCRHARTELKVSHDDDLRFIERWCLGECGQRLAFKVEKILDNSMKLCIMRVEKPT